MKPAPFDHHVARSVAEAVGLLGELGDAKVLAGGQSLVPLMALRLATPSHVVDVTRIGELGGIDVADDAVRIGAATTQTAVERYRDVTAAVPLLARALPHIGHFQIRNRGTIGGSIAHADPASELPAVALALDAGMTARGPRGERAIPAASFFAGTWDTALADDELLTTVSFPRWRGPCGFAIEEFTRRHGDFAIAGACVAVERDGSVIDRCAISLFGVGSTPERAGDAEAMVSGVEPADVDTAAVARRAVAGLTSVPSDLNGSADYRRHVAAVTVERALRRALAEADDA